jgi:hypothetical protein
MIQISQISITGDCGGGSNGSILIEVTGSSPSWTFSEVTTTGNLPTSAVTSTYFVNNLPSNYYVLEVQDSGGNSQLIPFYISSGTSISISSTGTTCGYNNGQIEASTTNVYGLGTYELYDSFGNLMQTASTITTSYTFQGLSADTNYVIANDGGGCDGMSATVLITPSTPFSFGYFVVPDSSCFDEGAGKIFLTGLTPSSAYTINWLSDVDGQTGVTITGLTENTYIVEVIDPQGCASTQFINVGNVPTLSVGTIFVTSPPTCFQDDAEVEVIVTGGTAPFYYSGSTGEVAISFGTSYTFTGVSSGPFSVQVTDAGLCVTTGLVNVQTPNSFSSVGINVTNSTCSSTNGSIQVLIDNGLPPLSTYTFVLSGDNGYYNTVISGPSNQIWNGIETGDYLVTVTDVNGCTFSGYTTVNNVDLFSITANTTGTTCGLNNGVCEVFVSTGGTLPYFYDLIGPNSLPDILSNNLGYFTGLQSGTFILRVTDSSVPACYQEIPVYIAPSNGVYFDLFPIQPSFGNDGSISVLITSGAAPFTFSWSGDVSGQTGTIITGLTSGDYTLQLTDKSGCTLTKTISLYGTKKVQNYEIYTLCEQQFQPTNTITRRGVRQMYWEGFFDLTSGDTNCIINSADFILQTSVGNETKEVTFYTSTSFDDYPNDILWAEAIVDTLKSYVGIDDVSIDLVQNRIKIIAGCANYPKNCEKEILNLLQDELVVVNLKIVYDISCVQCN